MSCIKTGANIYFRNYGTLVRGDVYFLGDVFIFRWNVHSIQFTDDKTANYVVDFVENSDSWWHRDDLGITVVPSYLVTAWER